MKKDIEASVKDVVKSLAASLEKDNEERFVGVIDALVDLYPVENMSVEDFSMLVSFDISERLLRTAAARYFPEVRRNHRLMSFAENYLMMDRILKRLFGSVPQTSMSTADHARWVLRHYERFVRDGQKPDEGSAQQEAFYPGFGDVEDWLRLCDAMLLLPFGDVERFLNIETKLLIRAQDLMKKPGAWDAPIKDALGKVEGAPPQAGGAG